MDGHWTEEVEGEAWFPLGKARAIPLGNGLDSIEAYVAQCPDASGMRVRTPLPTKPRVASSSQAHDEDTRALPWLAVPETQFELRRLH